MEFGEELDDHGGERGEGEVGVVGHRRGVRADRQLRDDAAIAIPQAADDGVPQGAVHQHPVQQHHHRPVAARVGVHEARGRRPLQLHPQTPLLLGVEPAQLRRRVVGHGTDLRLRPARLPASSAPSMHPPNWGPRASGLREGRGSRREAAVQEGYR